MAKIQIEKDFLTAMNQVYPKVQKDSRQFKVMRLVFYMGAFHISSKEMMDIQYTNELQEALKFSSEFAKRGIHPEETLADYVEE